MKPAVVVIDVAQADRQDHALCRPGTQSNKKVPDIYRDLVALLDASEKFSLPLVVSTYWNSCPISEVYRHPAFSRAKVIDKKDFDAFKNSEFGKYLKSINAEELIMGGFNLTCCLGLTAKSAANAGYRLHTASTLLYTYEKPAVTTQLYSVIMGNFASVHQSVEELVKVQLQKHALGF
jgi:nicotinamidase-related amidase